MATQAQIDRDLKTVALFIAVYCRRKHPQAPKAPVRLKNHDVAAIAGREISLCPACTKLLGHAFVKRTRCPLEPKPMCKHCPNHCYHPNYRAQIRQVMKSSGRYLVLTGRLDYLFHLLF